MQNTQLKKARENVREKTKIPNMELFLQKNNLTHRKIVQNKKKYEKYFTIVLFMTHNMCYNYYRKQDQIKINFAMEDFKMNENMRRINRISRMSNVDRTQKVYRFSEQRGESDSEFDCELPLVHESCKYSGFSLAAVTAAILMFAGIIIYAVIV